MHQKLSIGITLRFKLHGKKKTASKSKIIKRIATK
jgi:hypothetical protein